MQPSPLSTNSSTHPTTPPFLPPALPHLTLPTPPLPYPPLNLPGQVGLQTGWFGLASGCDVAAAAAAPLAKERLDATHTALSSQATAAAAAAASAAMSVAGFPGQNVVQDTESGKLYFPLMGDQRCRATGAVLCPTDAPPPGAGGDRTAGMLRHQCDTGKGMSGAPLWVHDKTREGAAASRFAGAEGFPGWRGSSNTQGHFSGYETGERGVDVPVVAVGVVSRHTGACPWGDDCVNLATSMDAHNIDIIRQWVARE